VRQEHRGSHLDRSGSSNTATKTEASIDYLGYIRVVRRTLGVAIVSSLLLATGRVIADFRVSVANGNSTLDVILVAYAATCGLALLVLVGLWIPGVIRTGVLRRSQPGASFFVVKQIPDFWVRLEAVTGTRLKRIQNATLVIDSTSASIWRGVFRPERLVDLPLHNLSRIERDREGVTPFRRRLMVLTFEIDDACRETPLALRKQGWFGYQRLSNDSQQQVVLSLTSLGNQASLS
jgi:hypothetical protein